MKVSKQWSMIVGGEGGYAVFDTDKDETNLTYGGCGCCGGGFDSAIDHEHVARLMAAAPELLRKLREIDRYGQDSVDTGELLERLKDIEFTEA